MDWQQYDSCNYCEEPTDNSSGYCSASCRASHLYTAYEG